MSEYERVCKAKSILDEAIAEYGTILKKYMFDSKRDDEEMCLEIDSLLDRFAFRIEKEVVPND